MPKYLSPGVYVEEIDAGVKEIPGVSTSLDEPGRGSLRRPSFFSGQLLDAATLAAEQDYHREKLRRHNLAVLGCGVVSGLAVSVEGGDSAGRRVVVEPGCAIDPCGEQICLPSAVSLAIRVQGDSAFVTLRYWERVCEAVVEEACVIGIRANVVAPALGLARLVRVDGRWQVDPAFAPPRGRHE